MALGVSIDYAEIAPGITFIRHNTIKDVNLADYSVQLDTLTKMAKRAIWEKAITRYLCFGMAGTGKTSLVKKSNWIINNSHNLECSRLEIKCNTLVFNCTTADIAKHYFAKAIFYIQHFRPMLVLFDELDALARNRVQTDPRITEFSHMVCSMLDEDFTKVVREQKQLVVVGITNDPEGVDDAVRDRLGPTIYVPLPTEQVICEILQKQGIPKSKKVASRITEHLGTDKISPRGLVDGCNAAKQTSSDLLRRANVTPTRIAEEILGAAGGRKSQREVEEYRRRNETYTKQSDDVLKRWGRLS